MDGRNHTWGFAVVCVNGTTGRETVADVLPNQGDAFRLAEEINRQRFADGAPVDPGAYQYLRRVGIKRGRNRPSRRRLKPALAV